MTLDLGPVFRGDRHSNGVGGYPILVRVGERHGLPLVTFTRDRRSVSTLVAPSVLYLAVMATGLREAHGWSRTQIEIATCRRCRDVASRVAYMTTQCVDDGTMTTYGSLLYPSAKDHRSWHNSSWRQG